MPINVSTGRVPADLSRTFDDLARRDLAKREFAALQRQRQIAAQQAQQDLALRQQQEARQAQTTQANLWMEAQAGNIANQKWAAGRQSEQAAEAENARRWNYQQRVAAEAAAELKKSQQYVRSRQALSEQLARQDAQEAAAARQAREVREEDKKSLELRSKSVEENWQKVLRQSEKGLDTRDPDPARAQRIAILRGTIQHVLQDGDQYEPEKLNQIKQDVYAEMLDLGLMEDLGFRQIEADGQTVTVGPTGRPVLPRQQTSGLDSLLNVGAATGAGISPVGGAGASVSSLQGGPQAPTVQPPGQVPPYGDFKQPPPERSYYSILGEELKKKSELSSRFDAAGKRLLSKIQRRYNALSDPAYEGQVREGAARAVLEQDVRPIEWESYLGPETAGTKEKRGESVIEHQGDGRDLTTGFLSDRAKDTMWDSKITQKGGNYYQWSKEKQDWVPIGPVFDESQNQQAKLQMETTKQQQDLQMKQRSSQLALQTKAQTAQLELQNKSRTAELELQRKTQEAVLEHANKTQETEDGAARETQKAYFENQKAELDLKMKAAEGGIRDPEKISRLNQAARTRAAKETGATEGPDDKTKARAESILSVWRNIPGLAKKVMNPRKMKEGEMPKDGQVYEGADGRPYYILGGHAFLVDTSSGGYTPSLESSYGSMPSFEAQ